MDHIFRQSEIAGCSALQSEILDSPTLPALLEAVSDCSALPRLLEAEWDGLLKTLARWIHIAKITKEAELLNVFEQR